MDKDQYNIQHGTRNIQCPNEGSIFNFQHWKFTSILDIPCSVLDIVLSRETSKLVPMTIRPMHTSDANMVLEIYQQGINTGMATFYTEIPTWETFDKKFLPKCRLVVEEDGEVIGWAVLSSVSIREFYNGVGEVTIYIHENARGKGVGKLLLNTLIEESERNGFWSLLSVIHDDNTVSIHMHEVCGFRIIGYRERIAQIHGKWKNTIMMERRSKIVGV